MIIDPIDLVRIITVIIGDYTRLDWCLVHFWAWYCSWVLWLELLLLVKSHPEKVEQKRRKILVLCESITVLLKLWVYYNAKDNAHKATQSKDWKHNKNEELRIQYQSSVVPINKSQMFNLTTFWCCSIHLNLLVMEHTIHPRWKKFHSTVFIKSWHFPTAQYFIRDWEWVNPTVRITISVTSGILV